VQGRSNGLRVFPLDEIKGDDSLVSAKVSAFYGSRALELVNEFLAENSYEVSEVHVQFVRTRVQTGANGGDIFTGVDETYEAYVTHPA
jgi:hypothetical protein